MRIRCVTFRDYGLFRGTQTLDLLPRTKHGRTRPIVLVGGHNGAGKTTILDGIRLCLYGRLALGNRIPENAYHGYLRERIHHSGENLIQPNNASITVEFDYARGGQFAKYAVERAWSRSYTNGSVHESLSVFRDGRPLDEVEAELWSDFVRSMVPPGVSQLFFFDGEKIQRLAEDDSEATALRDSVKALLGLDLVEQLQADLDLYVSRKVRKTSKDSADVKRLSIIDKQLVAKETDREALVQDQAQLRSQLDHLDAQLGKAEQALAEKGYGIAQKRAELAARKKELEACIGITEKAVRELFDGPIAVMACPTLCAGMILQLRAESELALWRASTQQVDIALRRVKRHLTTRAAAKRMGLSSSSSLCLRNELEILHGELLTRPSDVGTTELLHGLSVSEVGEIVSAFSHEGPGAVQRLAEHVRDVNRYEAELAKTQKLLNTAPDYEETASVVRQLSELQHKRAEARHDLDAKKEQLVTLEREVATLHRERAKILEEEGQRGTLAKRVVLAGRIRNALGGYFAELTKGKVQQLERETISAFRRLSRKNDLVSDIRFDPATFATLLVDRRGRTIPKTDLSAGEKQVYAVSLLWALARVSGRPLPMIIDTPLGRLDSRHRANLVTRYFPNAAHQVVILSTDTEIDRAYFSELRSETSHALRLENHGDSTEIAEGYFWKEAHADA